MPEIGIRSAIRRHMKQFDDDFKSALKKELEAPAKKLVTRYRRVVSNWSEKPVFSYRITINENTIRLTVYPKGTARDLFLWVDRGTKPHIITPKSGGFLWFRADYSAKTQPIARYGVGDGNSYGNLVKAQQVNHPGTKARKFSKKFGQDIKPDLREARDNAFQRAKRGS